MVAALRSLAPHPQHTLQLLLRPTLYRCVSCQLLKPTQQLFSCPPRQSPSATMEALFAQAMKETGVLRKTSVPWNLDEPHHQSYHAFDTATSSWISKVPSTTDAGQNVEGSDGITAIALYTWNIDFMLPFAEARMKPALAYLDGLLSSLPTTTAPVVFLQECTPSDLTTIAATPWVRSHFHLTDIDHTNWATKHYGTVVLIDARLPITATFRVHYSKTRMDRDAHFVDLSIGDDGKKVRLCNSHLESMALDPPFRPPQMQLIAGYLYEESVHAALAAGDFNAIQPFDRTLHADNNLKDAGASKRRRSSGSGLAVPGWTRFISAAMSSCADSRGSGRMS
ncbi:uncharacterized protein BJX67DRAFT_354512 [Aspergillus lucknowensis]|uniref:Endonuclease/exonuclease/phosphatase domain-containing protein n=1 Tax=Aspergillus lucknowensis TaxID=176173 RepID=A0ABR4LQF9_9EURO